LTTNRLSAPYEGSRETYCQTGVLTDVSARARILTYRSTAVLAAQRTHSRKQIRQIAESIGRFGFTNPVLIDDENRILAGQGRVEAARERGISTVPCLRFGHLSATETRAYVLADNKLALNAGWDEELLGLELKELMESDIEFDVGLTGFSIAEVDQLVEGLAHEDVGDPSDDRLPDPNRVVARCRRGDIWQAGSHRIICGDARDPSVLAALMDGDKCEMVFTDPPYDVAIEGNVSGLGKVRHGEFVMASGEMTRDQFTASYPRLSPIWLPIASTARSTSSAWIGGTWAKCCRLVRPTTPSSKT
jgi:hypothetical protein